MESVLCMALGVQSFKMLSSVHTKRRHIFLSPLTQQSLMAKWLEQAS